MCGGTKAAPILQDTTGMSEDQRVAATSKRLKREEAHRAIWGANAKGAFATRESSLTIAARDKANNGLRIPVE